MVIRYLCFIGTLSVFSSSALADHLARLPMLVRPCAVCHGPTGVSQDPYIPNLAGQNVEYLIAQLEAMARSTRRRMGMNTEEDDIARAGTSISPRWQEHRDNPVMDRQLLALNENTIRYVAAYFASKPRACPPPATPRAAPAFAAHCASCHGHDGRGLAPGVPHLAGQKPFYLKEQLRTYRMDGRQVQFTPDPTSRSNPVMGPQSALLTKAQAAELADWFASIPCSKDETSEVDVRRR